jgi:hypothetical protein
VVISTFTIVYCPTHIYRKGWLTIRLSLLIISQLGIRAFGRQNSFLPLQHHRPVILLLLAENNFMCLILLLIILPFLCLLWKHTLQQWFLYQTPTKLCRWNLRTQTISIGECIWSHISLVKVFFTLLTAPCRVLHLIWLMLRLVLPLPSALLFFVGSNKINLFWVLYSPLSLRGCVASCSRLFYFTLCLADAWEGTCLSI